MFAFGPHPPPHLGGYHSYETGLHLQAIDLVVQRDRVRDLLARCAVGVDAVRDPVEARQDRAAHRVHRLIVALADLKRRGADVVAAEGKRDQIHVDQGEIHPATPVGFRMV